MNHALTLVTELVDSSGACLNEGKIRDEWDRLLSAGKE